MKRISSILLFLVCLTGNVSAQKTFNNAVKFHLGGFSHTDKRFSAKVTSLIGGYYDRKIYKNVWVNAGYSQWKGWNMPIPPTMIENTPIIVVPLGTTIERSGYRMADISVLYRLQLAKHHYLRGGAGPSLYWGWNHNLETRIYDPNNPYEGRITTVREQGRYLGFTQQISYDYIFLKGRLNVGVDVRGRKYIGIPYGLYEYGFHAGVNF